MTPTPKPINSGIEKLMKYFVVTHLSPKTNFHTLAYELIRDDVFDDTDVLAHLIETCINNSDSITKTNRTTLFVKSAKLGRIDLFKLAFKKLNPTLNQGAFRDILQGIFNIKHTNTLLDIIKWLLLQVATIDDVDVVALGIAAFKQAANTDGHGSTILRYLQGKGYAVPVKKESTTRDTLPYLKTEQLLIRKEDTDPCIRCPLRSPKQHCKHKTYSEDPFSNKQVQKFIIKRPVAYSTKRCCYHALDGPTCNRVVSVDRGYCPGHRMMFKQRHTLPKILGDYIKIKPCFEGLAVELPGIIGAVMVNVEVKHNGLIVTATGKIEFVHKRYSSLTVKDKKIILDAGIKLE